MKTKLENLRIVNNFYQTSSYFPMPIVLCGTLDESGITNLGTYSLVFPYYVGGREYFSFMLITRNNSNTAKNLIRDGKISLNFIPDNKRYLKESVRLGFPGETTEQKMKDCIFTLTDGLMSEEHKDQKFPQIIEESFQVFECSWVRELDGAENTKIEEHYSEPYKDFNGITSHTGAHFILRVDKILMQPRYRQPLIDDVYRNSFPKIPINYGYRDNKNFWMGEFRSPYAEKIQARGEKVEEVMYIANTLDKEVRFTKSACKKLIKVPKMFLNNTLNNAITWAKENGVKLIDKKHIAIIQDKRNTEKAVKK
ncbi:MAG: hypothetical protein AB7S44_02130 [Spirochaetales bacterium]